MGGGELNWGIGEIGKLSGELHYHSVVLQYYGDTVNIRGVFLGYPSRGTSLSSRDYFVAEANLLSCGDYFTSSGDECKQDTHREGYRYLGYDAARDMTNEVRA